MIIRSFITFILVVSHVSMNIKSLNVKELVNKCTIEYNYASPSHSNVSLTFNEIKKSASKLVSGNLCPSIKVSYQVKVKIVLANCINSSNAQKPTVHCDFNSIQISFDNKKFDNKEIDLNGIVSVDTNIAVKLETLNFVINSKYLLETLSCTKNSENLTNSTPEIVKLVNCNLVNIETLTRTTVPSTSAENTTVAATTTKPTTTKPTTKKPTTKKPTTSKSTTPKPTTKKPTTTKSTTTKPTTTKPTTTKPTTAKPTTAKPTTAKPTTTKPATKKPTTKKPVTKAKTKSKSSNGKIALVILGIFILMGVGIIACYYKYRKKLSNRPAYYNDISLNDPLHAEIKFYKADGEDGEDNVEEDDDDDDILPLI